MLSSILFVVLLLLLLLLLLLCSRASSACPAQEHSRAALTSGLRCSRVLLSTH
jgi:hypothetical protein